MNWALAPAVRLPCDLAGGTAWFVRESIPVLAATTEITAHRVVAMLLAVLANIMVNSAAGPAKGPGPRSSADARP